MVTKLVQIAIVVSLVKSPIHFLELLLPYIISSFICRPDLSFVGLCHINLPPKLLGSSCESEKSLLRHYFHINAARLLVVEYLMWRQHLFLELLYYHAPGCSFAVLVFEVLQKDVFDGKSLFFHLSLGWPRIGLSSAASWAIMIIATFFVCDYGPWRGPQAQYKRWMQIDGLYDPTISIANV